MGLRGCVKNCRPFLRLNERLGVFWAELVHGTVMASLSLLSLAIKKLCRRMGQNS